MTPTTTLLTRQRRTFEDLNILEMLATESLADGRLVLTLERTAYALSVDLGTVRSLIETGELPAIRIGDHRGKPFVRVPAEAVLQFVRARTPQPTRPDLHVRAAISFSKQE